MKNLVVGYRGGWPGTKLEKITAHAVYKLIDPERMQMMKSIAILASASSESLDKAINMYRSAANEEGTVYGYGLVDGKGQIVNDADGVAEEHRNYTWVTPKILLPDECARDFEECARYQASQVFYTGIENCFTAIAKALVDLKDIIEGDSSIVDKKQKKDDIDRVLTQLGGMNLGLGAKYTNESWLGATATFAIKAFAEKNLPNRKPKRD